MYYFGLGWVAAIDLWMKISPVVLVYVFECVWIAVRMKRKKKRGGGGNPSSRSEDYSQTESKLPRQLGKTRIKTQGGKIAEV